MFVCSYIVCVNVDIIVSTVYTWRVKGQPQMSVFDLYFLETGSFIHSCLFQGIWPVTVWGTLVTFVL